MCWWASSGEEGESGVEEVVVVEVDWRLNPEECTSVSIEGFEDIDLDRRCVFFTSLLYLVAGGLDWLVVGSVVLVVSCCLEDEGGLAPTGSTQT